MTIDMLDSRPDALLASRLERFESRFRYPLGAGRSFRISHGEDYTRFFRAIGNARCFVVREKEEILGVVSVALCELQTPSEGTMVAAYFSDLKIASPASGRALLSLLRESIDWARRHAAMGFSVVMEGTRRSPDQYTGRLGIPRYMELARVMILRIPTVTAVRSAGLLESSRCTIDEARARHSSLMRNAFRTSGGDATLRSVIEPAGLMLRNGEACGIVEDTRRCKRLFANGADGAGAESEMVSAHLGCFGYASPLAAAALIQAACRSCGELGIPALFVALAGQDSLNVLSALAIPEVVKAPAAVYGFGFPANSHWSINTSEI